MTQSAIQSNAPPMTTVKKAEATSIDTNSTTDKTKKIQSEIDEVVLIMQDNVQKTIARGETVQSLKGKTETLATASKNFKKSSTQIKNKACCQGFQRQLLIAAIVIGIILGIVALFIILKNTKVLK